MIDGELCDYCIITCCSVWSVNNMFIMTGADWTISSNCFDYQMSYFIANEHWQLGQNIAAPINHAILHSRSPMSDSFCHTLSNFLFSLECQVGNWKQTSTNSVNFFQTNDQPFLVIISRKKGGEGKLLGLKDCVIHLSFLWFITSFQGH